MTCREFANFIADYLTGELPQITRVAFERHLGRCANCTEYLRQYEQSLKAGRRAFASLEDDVPQHVPEELVQAILAVTRRG